jgi:hypothetical protein
MCTYQETLKIGLPRPLKSVILMQGANLAGRRGSLQGNVEEFLGGTSTVPNEPGE